MRKLEALATTHFVYRELQNRGQAGEQSLAVKKVRALKPHLSAAVIEHCHSSKAGIIGRLAAYLAGVRKIIFTVHGWGITPEQGRLERFFYTWAERLAGVLSTDVVCVSEADRERGLKERLAPAAKLKVIGQLVTQFEHIPFLKSEKMF